jgi:hypothetical protein
MDWKLIFQLSLLGLAMGIATVFFIPPNVEPVVWLIIFLVCAYIIARRRPTGRLAHGLLLGWQTPSGSRRRRKYVEKNLPKRVAVLGGPNERWLSALAHKRCRWSRVATPS